MGGGMRGRPRRRAVLVSAVIALSMFAVSCSGSSSGPSGGGPAQQGGTLRIGTSSGIAALNPFVGFNQDDYSTWMYIYPSLLQYDTTSSTYDYIPGFAKTWEQSADGLSVTFHTTPNATWS